MSRDALRPNSNHSISSVTFDLLFGDYFSWKEEKKWERESDCHDDTAILRTSKPTVGRHPWTMLCQLTKLGIRSCAQFRSMICKKYVTRQCAESPLVHGRAMPIASQVWKLVSVLIDQ